jgi:hypothetical protein
VLALLGSLGCSGSLPRPPVTEHPSGAYTDVAYPPPAALAEVVPERPPMDAVWLDGDWAFRASGYSWVRGGWVTPPEGAAYAPSRVFYAGDGRILFAPAGWYTKTGEKIEHIEPVVPAGTPTNEYTAESQTAR